MPSCSRTAFSATGTFFCSAGRLVEVASADLTGSVGRSNSFARGVADCEVLPIAVASEANLMKAGFALPGLLETLPARRSSIALTSARDTFLAAHRTFMLVKQRTDGHRNIELTMRKYSKSAASDLVSSQDCA